MNVSVCRKTVEVDQSPTSLCPHSFPRKLNGRVSGMVSRTNFELNCIVGLPGSRWRGEAFSVEPFQLPTGYLARLAGPSEAICSNGSKPRHPMYYAQRWSKELADTPGLTISQVAEREGFARKRLNSILRLLRFPSDVQNTLVQPLRPRRDRLLPGTATPAFDLPWREGTAGRLRQAPSTLGRTEPTLQEQMNQMGGRF